MHNDLVGPVLVPPLVQGRGSKLSKKGEKQEFNPRSDSKVLIFSFMTSCFLKYEESRAEENHKRCHERSEIGSESECNKSNLRKQNYLPVPTWKFPDNTITLKHLTQESDLDFYVIVMFSLCIF